MEIVTRHVGVPTTDGGMRTFIARPAGDERLPLIVVIHEIYGLTPHFEDLASRFAREGFVVAAPDLFFKLRPLPEFTDRESFMRFRQSIDDDTMVSYIGDCISFMKEEPNVDGAHVGIVGYCFGGYTALLATAANPAITALADYYGGGNPETVHAAAGKVRVPVLGMFGGKDQGIPVEVVHETERILKENGVPTEFHIYPDAEHAFFNDTGQRYNEAAAKDAWPKTVAFFNQTLKP